MLCHVINGVMRRLNQSSQGKKSSQKIQTYYSKDLFSEQCLGVSFYHCPYRLDEAVQVLHLESVGVHVVEVVKLFQQGLVVQFPACKEAGNDKKKFYSTVKQLDQAFAVVKTENVKLLLILDCIH